MKSYYAVRVKRTGIEDPPGTGVFVAKPTIRRATYVINSKRDYCKIGN